MGQKGLKPTQNKDNKPSVKKPFQDLTNMNVISTRMQKHKRSQDIKESQKSVTRKKQSEEGNFGKNSTLQLFVMLEKLSDSECSVVKQNDITLKRKDAVPGTVEANVLTKKKKITIKKHLEAEESNENTNSLSKETSDGEITRNKKTVPDNTYIDKNKSKKILKNNHNAKTSHKSAKEDVGLRSGNSKKSIKENKSDPEIMLRRSRSLSLQVKDTQSLKSKYANSENGDKNSKKIIKEKNSDIMSKNESTSQRKDKRITTSQSTKEKLDILSPMANTCKDSEKMDVDIIKASNITCRNRVRKDKDSNLIGSKTNTRTRSQNKVTSQKMEEQFALNSVKTDKNIGITNTNLELKIIPCLEIKNSGEIQSVSSEKITRRKCLNRQVANEKDSVNSQNKEIIQKQDETKNQSEKENTKNTKPDFPKKDFPLKNKDNKITKKSVTTARKIKSTRSNKDGIKIKENAKNLNLGKSKTDQTKIKKAGKCETENLIESVDLPTSKYLSQLKIDNFFQKNSAPKIQKKVTFQTVESEKNLRKHSYVNYAELSDNGNGKTVLVNKENKKEDKIPVYKQKFAEEKHIEKENDNLYEFDSDSEKKKIPKKKKIVLKKKKVVTKKQNLNDSGSKYDEKVNIVLKNVMKKINNKNMKNLDKVVKIAQNNDIIKTNNTGTQKPDHAISKKHEIDFQKISKDPDTIVTEQIILEPLETHMEKSVNPPIQRKEDRNNLVFQRVPRNNPAFDRLVKTPVLNEDIEEQLSYNDVEAFDNDNVEMPVLDFSVINIEESINNNFDFEIEKEPSPKRTINILENRVLRRSVGDADSPIVFPRRPNANSTMLVRESRSPWRLNVNTTRNPHFLKLKGNALPSISQEIILDHIVDDEIVKSNKTPRHEPEPAKKDPVQKSMLNFISSSIHNLENENLVKSSLFDDQEFSPIKQNKISPRSPLKEITDRSNQLNSFSTPVLVEGRLTRIPNLNVSAIDKRNMENEPSLYGFNTFSEESENVVRQIKQYKRNPLAKPSRFNVNIKKKQPVVQKENVEEENVQEAENIEEAENEEEEEKIEEAENVECEVQENVQVDIEEELEKDIRLFEDLEDPTSNKPTKSYDSKRKKRQRMLALNTSNEDNTEKPKKRKKDMMTKEEELAFKKWTEEFNATCNEIDKVQLEIE